MVSWRGSSKCSVSVEVRNRGAEGDSVVRWKGSKGKLDAEQFLMNDTVFVHVDLRLSCWEAPFGMTVFQGACYIY